MPYSNDELKANEHYQDLKTRDELKYVKDFSETRQKFLANGGKAHDGLRLADDKLLLFEDPKTGGTITSPTQSPQYIIFQKRYRTSIETKDIIDREFKEF